MPTYTAPVRDMQFVLHELLPELTDVTPQTNDELTEDLLDAILVEAAKLCETVIAPLNRVGDEHGCVYDNGEVRTPPGFKEAYQQYVDGGWTGLRGDVEFGGQGLPVYLATTVREMLCASNLAFSIYPGLSEGAANALGRHGTEEQKQTYLTRLIDGSWTGTMCLTESQCGTDLGLIRTRAEPDETGGYSVSGSKIFISAGEHDLTENIIHLVLARAPGGPAGIKGISLFLVPKFEVNADGSLGARNGVRCGSIEHKMGIHGSATCVLHFDEARGYLVGDLHKGMRAMFTMMNTARFAVGIQGLAIAEAAYQGAVEYARERLQGRALDGRPAHPGLADPIIVHPDIRRMLLTMRAYTEGARALAAWVAVALGNAQGAPSAPQRQQAEEFVSLLTPIVKALFTDIGSECANLGVQVFGGHGYIREHGMEQLIRDVRICQIYEGTNGVQALDLVGRKLAAQGGGNLRLFFHPVAAFVEEHRGTSELRPYVEPLAEAFGQLQRTTLLIARRGMDDPNEAAAVAIEYLRLFGLVAMAYVWAKMAALVLARPAGNESEFYQAKLETARFFMQRLLPQTHGLYHGIVAGAGAVTTFPEESF